MPENNGGMPKDIKTVLFWGLGIGMLALVLLILSILFGNLSNNVGGFDRETATYINESSSYVLETNTANVLDNGISTMGYLSISVTAIHNATGGNGTLIPATNYTVDVKTGTVTNASIVTYDDVNISYVVTFKGQSELDTDYIIGNYTESAVNTAQQFPVTGTILGIALLLSILIGILVFAIRKMMGVANVGSGDSNASFG